MADFGSPVAQNVNPVGQGVQTLSGLLGIKQQQQALQTGAIQQQTAQAESQQAQQKNAELTAVGTLTKNAYTSGRYKNSDGSFNNQAFASDVAQVAPTYGQAIANDATVRAGEIYQNQKTLFGLNAARREQVGDALGTLAAQTDPTSGQPTVNHNQVIDTIEQLRQQNPNDLDYSRMLTSMAASIPPTASGQQLQQTLRNMALMTKSPTAGQTDQTMGTMQGPNGLQAVNTNPQAVGGVGPRGPGMAQGLAPTEQPGYHAAVTSATARAGGNAGSDIDRGNQVSGLQQQSAAAIPLTQRIDQLSDDIASGKVAKMISETGNYFGISSINEARSQLNKDLGQVKALAIQNSGSDARAATVLEGYPTDTTPASTTHAAMDYIRGTARQNLARGQLLSQYQKADPSLKGFQAADTILTGTSNPLMHEFMALPPAQRAGFYKRNFSTPQEAQSFKDQVTALQKHTNGIVGQ